MSYSSEVLADSPLAYYRLGEASGQPQDSSGNAQHTTVTGGTPSYGADSLIPVDLGLDDAITLDGSTEYFTAPDSGVLDYGDTFTFECWIKRSETSSTESWIIGKGYDGLTPAGEIGLVNHHLTLASPTIAIICEGTVSMQDTDAHHLVATKDGSAVKLYVDGEDCTGTVTDSLLGSNAAPFTIGAEYNNGAFGFHFAGTVDEVAVYGTVLSPARVAAHYAAATTSAQTISPGGIVHNRGLGTPTVTRDQQVAFPTADSVDNGWTDQAGGTSLFAAIDESAFSDADYIQSPANPNNSACRVKLGTVADPESSVAHEIHWRPSKDFPGGPDITHTVRLYQGGGDVLGAGTLIASFIRSPTSFTTYVETLSGAEADAITNYADLYLEFNAVMGGGT